MPKRDDIGREIKKKISVPNSVQTQPEEENSEKKKKQKNSNIEKPLSGIIFSQNEIRLAEKERKKFYSQIPLILDPSKKIPKKNSKKIKKKLKNLFPTLFLVKTIGREIVDKILVPNSIHSRPGKENSEKNSKKI